MNKKHLFC